MGSDLVIPETIQSCNYAASMRFVEELNRRLAPGNLVDKIAPQMHYSTKNNGRGFLQEFGHFLPEIMGGDLVTLEATESYNCAAKM